MKLIIHTGHGKTGSSSIQASLKKNQNLLKNNKIYYCGLNFEHSPVKKYDWQKPFGWPNLCELEKNEFDEQLYSVINDTVNKLQKNNYDTLIWSNESLFVNFDKLSNVLLKLQENLEIETITYIRRPDKWIKSAYYQWGIKHKSYPGKIKSFREWVTPNKYQFHHHIEKWFKLENSNHKIINFDKCGDVSQHFLQYVDLKSSNTVRANNTLSDIELSFFALYNSLFENEVLPNEISPLIKKYNIKQLNKSNIKLDQLMPKSSDLDAILNDSNDELSKINSILKKQNQPQFNLESQSVNEFSLNNETLISVLIHIINEQSKEIEEIKKSLKTSIQK